MFTGWLLIMWISGAAPTRQPHVVAVFNSQVKCEQALKQMININVKGICVEGVVPQK
jgi:hypothetical protein